MVNHAGLMVGPKPRGAWERALIRLIGLLLTVHYGRPPQLCPVARNRLRANDRSPSSASAFLRLPNACAGCTTDFLGGRMFVEPHRPPGCEPEADRPDDVYFDDPPEAGPNEIRFWGHSFYYLDGREDPRFREYVERVLRPLDSPPP